MQKKFLYFISLNPDLGYPVHGVFFKLGLADTIDEVMEPYSGLPIEPLYHEVDFYEVPSMAVAEEFSGLVQAELISTEDHPEEIEIRRFRESLPGCAKDWLHVPSLSMSRENIKKVAETVQLAVSKIKTAILAGEDISF